MKMRKNVFLFLSATILMSCSTMVITKRIPSEIESVNKLNKKVISRIAVIDIESNSSVTNDSYCMGMKMGQNIEGSGEIVRSFAELELLKHFDVVDRTLIDNIISEQDLQNSKRVDNSSAVQIGKILGCDAVLVGGVSQAEASLICNSTVGALYIGVCSINMRLIDVETGMILWVGNISRSTPNYFEEELSLSRSELNHIIKKKGGDMSAYVFGNSPSEIVEYVLKQSTKELILDII